VGITKDGRIIFYLVDTASATAGGVMGRKGGMMEGSVGWGKEEVGNGEAIMASRNVRRGAKDARPPRVGLERGSKGTKGGKGTRGERVGQLRTRGEH
jgi:hypothetical protein